MGWLFMNDKLRHQTPVEYITRMFTTNGEATSATVISAAAVRSTIFAAIRNHDKTTGGSYVFCGIFKLKNNQRDGFGYKDMDETMGPCEVDCPDRIVRLLSPVEDIPNPGYAAEWRKSVAAAKARKKEARASIPKLAIGDKVQLAYPVWFKRAAVSADAFIVIRFRGKTPIFIAAEHPGLVCRLQRASLEGAVITRA